MLKWYSKLLQFKILLSKVILPSFFHFLSGGHSGLETLKYLLFSPHRLQKNWACHRPSYDTENQCPASWSPVTFTVFTLPMKLLFSS